MTQSKTCSRCAQIKPLNDFCNSSTNKDGKDSRCRKCKSAQFKEWSIANKTHNLERSKQWRIDNPERNRNNKNAWNSAHPKKAQERTKAWVANNKDKKRKSNKEWELANAEKVRLKNRNWAASNPQKIIQKNLRRNSRVKAGGIYLISKTEINHILAKPCFYCGLKEQITIDHVMPVSRNGKHSIGNLVAACKSCNSSKKDRTITEWNKQKTALQVPTHT